MEQQNLFRVIEGGGGEQPMSFDRLERSVEFPTLYENWRYVRVMQVTGRGLGQTVRHGPTKRVKTRSHMGDAAPPRTSV